MTASPRLLLPGLTLLATGLAAGCAAPEPAPESTAAAAVHAAWTYEGTTGPDHWAEQYPECAPPGDSPVDLTGAVAEALPALRFDYHPVEAHVHDTGHSIQIDAPGGTLQVDADTFALVQVHFHVPSEHAVDGRVYDAEAHFVHRDAAGSLAVVGVLLETGAAPAPAGHAADSLWAHLPTDAAPEQTFAFDPAGLLPADHGYFTYPGSLTTPPCSDGVRWIVLDTPVALGAGSVEHVARYHPHNARPLQLLGDRVIRRSAP